MKKSTLLPLLMIAMAACNHRSNSLANDNSNNTGHSATQLTGTYQGTLPCADCPGMDYQVSLYDDHTFSELVAYQGRGQDIATVASGTWQQTSDSTVMLKKKTDSSSFLASEGKLLLLDPNGKRIEGVLASNFELKAIAVGDRRPMLAEKAKAGIRFTANGNQPGWRLDLDHKMIYFHATNGDSLQVALPAPQPNTDTLKVYTTPDITISIRNIMCSDDISGLMRPNTVQVQVKDKNYQGCGEYIGQ
ncbi:copper resistance protein NlpE N-terminal domain-containing protein [Chitinophaga sp. 30R24]|uniref:copper resistance protein NlpE N-terminal domain-containing protein n=1 Tax=Chitinophaga sp. 30R24 TaxID=3248838 RepID=UPI003B8F8744